MDSVRLLLVAAADVNMPCLSGTTPLDNLGPGGAPGAGRLF